MEVVRYRGRKMKIIKQLIVSLIVLASTLLFACTMMMARIDSISTSQTAFKKKYILLPGLKNVSQSDLQFKEFSRYIEKALNSRGYIKVEDVNDAEIAILVLYGISAPQSTISSVPIYGQTGISSSSTVGTISTFGSTSTFSGSTYYTPKYGVVGSMPVTRTKYTRYLVLDAYDLDEFRESSKELEIWKTTVISSGRSGDLREIFPYLIVASTPYIGTNTGKQVTVKIFKNDKRVLEIKGLN
jgi:hypothetical protein